MSIYSYEEAFGAWDRTSRPMRRAIKEWFDLYYRQTADEHYDPSQRIACAVVSKLVRSVFGEYTLTAADPFVRGVGESLETVKKDAMQLALVGGECYLKPCPTGTGFSFTLIPRNNVLIFARGADGMPTDLGTLEHSVHGSFYYTLLERRRVDDQGRLQVENRLFRSRNGQSLGEQVALRTHPDYRQLPEKFCYDAPLGLGLVRLKTPLLNCVDGSPDGVSVYAPAVGLIRAIDRNESQLNGEFERGESRIIVSRDMLDRGQLKDKLFVGLDDDPEHVGLTVFAPVLREQSFLARKQEYLRNVESLIGLKRGMLSDANLDQRTATEIASSAGEYSLTVMDFQQMWQKAVAECIALCALLGQLFGLGSAAELSFAIDWGNGVLYDEDKTWEQYVQMVDKGLLVPEIALGWRFNMPADTAEQRKAIREKLMPGAMDNRGVAGGDGF